MARRLMIALAGVLAAAVFAPSAWGADAYTCVQTGGTGQSQGGAYSLAGAATCWHAESDAGDPATNNGFFAVQLTASGPCTSSSMDGTATVSASGTPGFEGPLTLPWHIALAGNTGVISIFTFSNIQHANGLGAGTATFSTLGSPCNAGSFTFNLGFVTEA